MHCTGPINKSGIRRRAHVVSGIMWFMAVMLFISAVGFAFLRPQYVTQISALNGRAREVSTLFLELVTRVYFYLLPLFGIMFVVAAILLRRMLRLFEDTFSAGQD